MQVLTTVQRLFIARHHPTHDIDMTFLFLCPIFDTAVSDLRRCIPQISTCGARVELTKIQLSLTARLTLKTPPCMCYHAAFGCYMSWQRVWT